MPKMLISGGNGFLGSYLAEKALEEGYDVTVVDDLSTSKEIQVPNKVNFIKKRIEKFSTKEKFDFVLHLAARPSPEDYISKPIRTILSNSIGTYHMLEIAKKSNAVFVYTSSSEIYGNAQALPTPEEYFGNVNPSGIRSCYDEGKRFSEALAMAYHRQYGLDVRIERPFNVYGPRIRADGLYGRVIPRFIMQALENKPITVHGDGTQTRSFLYISDWLDATWKFMTIEEPKYRIINVGSDKEIRIIELANTIKNLTGSSSRIVFTEKRAEDPQRRAADISKAKEMLSWEPKIGLEEGLKHTIEWFRERSRV
jgi:UDP-glucuronate decarboxylase